MMDSLALLCASPSSRRALDGFAAVQRLNMKLDYVASPPISFIFLICPSLCLDSHTPVPGSIVIWAQSDTEPNPGRKRRNLGISSLSRWGSRSKNETSPGGWVEGVRRGRRPRPRDSLSPV